MRSLFLLSLSFFLFAGCGNDEADPATEPASEEEIAEVPPTFCEDDGQVIIVEEQLGDGVEAAVENMVTINYEGRFEDGEVFDSGEGVQYPLSGFVPGFRDGVVGMKVGGRRELTIPGSQAYGPDGSRDPRTGEVVIPPCATLIFDVELLDIEH